MAKDRMRRVNKAVQEVVGAAILDLLDSEKIGLVTVTGVDIRPDLRSGDVFVTVLGNEDARERALEALNRTRGPIQRRIAAELRIKNTPTLRFKYDDTTDQAFRIGGLLSSELD